MKKLTDKTLFPVKNSLLERRDNLSEPEKITVTKTVQMCKEQEILNAGIDTNHRLVNLRNHYWMGIFPVTIPYDEKDAFVTEPETRFFSSFPFIRERTRPDSDLKLRTLLKFADLLYAYIGERENLPGEEEGLARYFSRSWKKMFSFSFSGNPIPVVFKDNRLNPHVYFLRKFLWRLSFPL